MLAVAHFPYLHWELDGEAEARMHAHFYLVDVVLGQTQSVAHDGRYLTSNRFLWRVAEQSRV